MAAKDLLARDPDLVVGVGASAGGLDALERLFTPVDPETPLAFVVAQHLSSDHKSMMVELLSRRTRLRVTEAHDGDVIARGHVYLAPAHANVVLEAGQLRLVPRPEAQALNFSVDQMLRSLAGAFGERAVAVVLSGTGSDGRDGVLAIKKAGGLVLVQEPESAQFDGMPREAMRTGIVDTVLPPEGLAEELARLGTEHGWLARMSGELAPEEAFAKIVGSVRAATGFDLDAYKRSTVLRRLERRLAARTAPDLAHYADLVADDGQEARRLVSEVLIHVTGFFRDGEVFDALATRHLTELRARFPDDALRVWVPGCSTGEEVFSLAMLLSERGVDFKLYGTDIDDEALGRAGLALYDAASVEPLGAERIERYFIRRDGRYEVSRKLRERVVFAKHDVLRDAPFTRMHFVSCRNLLIYLTPGAQRHVLDSLAFAVRPGGLLLLGTSEVIGVQVEYFQCIDHPSRLFLRREGRRVVPNLPRAPRLAVDATPSDEERAASVALHILTDRVVEAAVLVGDLGRVLRVFGNAGRLLTLPVGEASLVIGALLPDALRAVANIAMHRALSSDQEVELEVGGSNDAVAAVRAIPFGLRGASKYIVLVFGSRRDPSRPTADVDQVGVLQRELETARHGLQVAVEELEASNEELQATNEELLASNEELQATNEELQSVNEELHSVNVEHQRRIVELSETNADLDNLLNATPVATLFLDENLGVRRFNPPISSLFSVVDADRGRPLAHFTSVFSGEPLAPDLERVLTLSRPVEREVTTVAGRRYYMRAVPHVGPERRVCGVVMTFSDVTALHESRQSQDLLQSVLDAIPATVAVLDDDGIIRFVNAAWIEFGRANGAMGTAVGSSYLDACLVVPEVRTAIEAVLRGHRPTFEHVYPCHAPTTQHWYLMHVQRTRDGSRTVVSHTDITSMRRSYDAKDA